MSEANRVVPSRALQTALTKSLGICDSMESQICYLEDLAKVCPEIDEQVLSLRLKHDHLDALAREGLKGTVSIGTDIERG